jgi:tetratricopeptide (TPR) repeat protein
VAFSADGETLAAGVGSFNPPSAREFAIDLRSAATGESLGRLAGPEAEVYTVAFAPSGPLVAAGTIDGKVYLWDHAARTLRETWDLGTAPVNRLTFVPGTTRVLIAQADGRVMVRDAEGKAATVQTVLPGGATALAISIDGRRVAVGDGRGGVRLLSLPDLQPVGEPRAGAGRAVRALAFSPDGKFLASGGDDRQVVLWETATLTRLLTLPQRSPVQSVAFDADGLRLAISGVEEQVTLWNLALVRPQLVQAGLDLDGASAPVETAATFRPPPEMKTVRRTTAAAKKKADDPTARLEALLAQRRFEEVVRLAGELVARDPKDRELYVLLSNAHYGLGDVARASAAAERHLELCPDCIWALHRLADCRRAEGRTDLAILLLERVLERNPNEAATADELAWLTSMGPPEARDPAKALPLAQKAVTLSPATAAYHVTLAAVYLRQGDAARCRETLKAAPAARSPDEVLVRTLVEGLAAAAEGEVEEARRLSDKAAGSKPPVGFDPNRRGDVERAAKELAAAVGPPGKP